MKYIFIGFYGWPKDTTSQAKFAEVTGGYFECWNLEKYSLTDFVKAIQIKIQPVNENVLKNYVATAAEDMFGITEEQYKNCSWGILVPHPAEHYVSYGEVAGIINLFSNAFLRPAFHASDFGIQMVNKKVLGNWLFYQNKYELLGSKNFVDFYQKMLPSARYFIWLRDNVLTWADEDWRLYMAASFYSGLEEYENSKAIYTWQRESADMATLLETLFTAGESEKEEIGYRLRKRAFVLIGWKFPDIEKEIKKLYNDRSDFVHGSFYKKVVKMMRKNKEADPAFPPGPDFRSLYAAKEKVRFILVAYLYLHDRMQSDTNLFVGYDNVQSLLEAAVSDTVLRGGVVQVVKEVVDLVPEAEAMFE